MNKVFTNKMTGRFLALGFTFASLGLAQDVIPPSVPNPQTRSHQLRQLNGKVLGLHAQLQQAALDDAEAIRNEGVDALRARAAQLAALINEDPSQALSFAFSPEVLVDLAAKFPEAVSLLESHGIWKAPIQSYIIDYPGGSHRTQHKIQTGNETLELHFSGSEPADMQSGNAISVEGVRLGKDVAASDTTVQETTQGSALCCSSTKTATTAMTASVTTVSATTASATTCSTTGVQNVAVLLMLLPGQLIPSYLTQANVYQSFFGATGYSLDGYWREASYGKTSATGSVFGWYTYTSSTPDWTQDAINVAGAAGVNFLNYNRIFIVNPDFGAGWAGLANMGCSPLNSPAGAFNASTSLINGTVWRSGNNNAATIAMHEGGHNLGLNHANSRAFGAEALGPLGAAGTVQEYGDGFSAMSDGVPGHYATPHKVEKLGWIGPNNYQVVQSGGTWTLQPYEATAAGFQALKIQRGTGNNAWLWVEYRQPAGNYDSAYAGIGALIFSGALIHYEESLTDYTYLLDFTPSSAYSFSDPALPAGQTWVDPYTNLSITVVSATPNGLTVSISYSGTTPCTHANPTVSMSPANPSVSAGASVIYSVSVTNHDSSGCSASTFSLTSTQPSGWFGALSLASISASPGQTASATLSESVPASATPGTYVLGSAATNGLYTGSGTANSTVATVAPSTLTDTTSISSASYTIPHPVYVTATVQSGSTPAAGANVTFTLTKADGIKVTGTATTDSTGKATWSYKLGRKDPIGSYSVMNSASYVSQIATSNTATFTVQ